MLKKGFTADLEWPNLGAWKEYHKNSIEFASQCHSQLGIDQPQQQLKGTYANPFGIPTLPSGGRLIDEHASIQGLYLQATGDPAAFICDLHTTNQRTNAGLWESG